MDTHLRVLSESYPMNTNMTQGLDIFKKSLHPCALDESSLSIQRVNPCWKCIVYESISAPKITEDE